MNTKRALYNIAEAGEEKAMARSVYHEALNKPMPSFDNMLAEVNVSAPACGECLPTALATATAIPSRR